MNNQVKKPVTIERDVNDVVIIEGVRYSGDLFRTMSLPDTDVLYAVVRDGDTVTLKTIRNENEAEQFFNQVFLANEMNEEGQEDPAPTEEEINDGI